MGIFNKSKLKIRRESAQDVTKFNIEYYRVQEAEEFKLSLLKDLMGNNLCLAIIDTKLQYQGVINTIDEFITSIENSNISYRKKTVKEDETKKVLGISMKASSSSKTKRHMLGILISTDNLDKIEEIIKAYNTYYYIDFSNLNGNDLLDKIELYFEDEEELFNSFGLSVFDSNAFNNMNIKVNTKYYNHVNEILEKCYQTGKGHI